MRICLLLITLVFSITATAGDAKWFVSVYGESMQMISGASATPNVSDGVFLSKDFVGSEIYVRVQKGYELDGFRPAESESADDGVTSVSDSAITAASASSEEQSMDEFGPLVDTGLQYYINYEYFGWGCSKMYVRPMGEGVYRLRCDETMKHTNS